MAGQVGTGVTGGETWMMFDLHPAIPLPASLTASGLRLTLAPGAQRRLSELPKPGAGIVLLAGPEGGLSPRERECAAHAGFEAVRLGPRVLRTETAALAALAGMHALWGDF